MVVYRGEDGFDADFVGSWLRHGAVANAQYVGGFAKAVMNSTTHDDFLYIFMI
jgi:hypothetical protein